MEPCIIISIFSILFCCPSYGTFQKSVAGVALPPNTIQDLQLISMMVGEATYLLGDEQWLSPAQTKSAMLAQGLFSSSSTFQIKF